MGKVLYRLASAVIAVLVVTGFHAARAEILQLRFNWAPIFCYAGSNNGVPKEFCGQGADGTPRFQRHRLSLLKPFTARCSNIPAYDASALSANVRQHLACTNPSYVRLSNPALPAPLTVILTRSAPSPPLILQIHPCQR